MPGVLKASALRAAAPVAADEQDAMPGVLTGQGVVRAGVDHGPVIVAVALSAVAGRSRCQASRGSLARSAVAAKQPAEVVTRWLAGTATA